MQLLMLQKHRNASCENTINDFKMEIFYQMCASIVAIFKCTACLHTSHPPPGPIANAADNTILTKEKHIIMKHAICVVK